MSFVKAVDVSQEDCIQAWGKPDTLNGYSRVSLDNKVHYAHRLAYIAANGAVPQGYHVHHLCENKMCINPNHLIAVTMNDHQRIHIKPKAGEYYANQQYCKNGHEFDGTYKRNGREMRLCMTCRRKTSREWARNNRNKGANRVTY